MSDPSHLDATGAARMVDVGEKPVTRRQASAEARIRLGAEALALLADRSGDPFGESPKGGVLATARLAGIQAAKRTAELIPLCHQIPLTQVAIAAELLEATGELRLIATARAEARTGVEMEALTAVSVAALTVYDMLKSIDRAMSFTVALLEKEGGRSGAFKRGSSQAAPD